MEIYLNERGYIRSLLDVLEYGEDREDRTGVGTKSLFGLTFKYDLRNYPLLTTKKMPFRVIAEELFWFLRGSTDITELQKKNVKIWDGNDTAEYRQRINTKLPIGDLGATYGFQFRHFGAEYHGVNDYSGQGYDQVQNVLDLIKTDPNSRRMIINLWNPKSLKDMLIPPCLVMYQFYVSRNKFLNLAITQRSGDLGLGVPFNVASASLLVYIIAKMNDLTPGELTHNIGDAHIYNNHIEPLKTQLERTPYSFPGLIVKVKKENITDYNIDDFELQDYNCHPNIKMDMAI
jgi:thymidylate synthase